MTDIDLDKLEALADRCTGGDPWYKEGDLCGRQTFGQFIPQDRAFIAAANPVTILELIASARRDAEEIERLRKIAEALSAAISWLDYPFIDNNTSEAELLSRVGFMMRDAERHRAALTARAAHTGEG